MKQRWLVIVFFVLFLVAPRGMTANEIAPDFSLPDLKGQVHSLSDFKGKVVVLNFWASWCPECLAEMPELERFQREYKDKGVVLIGINIDRSEEKAREMVKKTGISFLNLIDKQGDVFIDRYAIFGLPATVVIGPDMSIVKRIIGRTSYERLKDIVERAKGRSR